MPREGSKVRNHRTNVTHKVQRTVQRSVRGGGRGRRWAPIMDRFLTVNDCSWPGLLWQRDGTHPRPSLYHTLGHRTLQSPSLNSSLQAGLCDWVCLLGHQQTQRRPRPERAHEAQLDAPVTLAEAILDQSIASWSQVEEQKPNNSRA